jgi:hypothetical protein
VSWANRGPPREVKERRLGKNLGRARWGGANGLALLPPHRNA